VGIGKASGSDSLMTCRNLATGIETGVSMQSRDESGGKPVYWPGGVRHSGDASPVCGFRVEREKAHPDTVRWIGWREGVSQAARNREGLSTDAVGRRRTDS